MRLNSFAVAALVAAVLTGPATAVAAEKAKNDRAIKDGMTVSFDYTLKETDGKIIESSKGKSPLTYVHGQKQMIPGLEKQLMGMKVGDEKNVRVKPEEAYGPVNKDAVQEISKEKIPSNGLKVGAVLQGQDQSGRPLLARVREIKDKTVVVDYNHPMAGKTLVFVVKIVDIQPTSTAPAQPAKPNTPAKPDAPAKPAEPGKK
jgi:FKBP-type peptidyl-prolyl cis-trans isomerase SlyD